ncbi:helix-turn-helix domain-containing protein, partial [Paracoccaceae bacterium]|nr:helix-turn-helix domain-containing protein [Paracoccaceae bacterium]
MKQKIARKYIFNRKLLSDLMHENMLVQQDLASALEISQAQISKILKGVTESPSVDKIQRMATYFKVENGEFFTLNPNWQDNQDEVTHLEPVSAKKANLERDEQSLNTSQLSSSVNNREQKLLTKITAVANDQEMD